LILNVSRYKQKIPNSTRLSEIIRTGAIRWKALDTCHWRSICDVTLTLKQARLCRVPCDSPFKPAKIWFDADEIQCKKAFRHFMNVLNRAVFGNAFRRHGKRLRVIPVLEKKNDGRWNFHAAIEPPNHLTFEQFKTAISISWDRTTDWGYWRILVRPNANRGWIDYMLKPSQKSGLEAWIDCIDLECLNNPNC
jgi:hypothetical protein